MEHERIPARRVRADQQLDLVLRVARSVLDTDVWGVASTVARAGAELVGAQQGSVGLVDPESGEVFTAASLELPSVSGRTRFARGEGVAGWVAEARRPALIPDVRKDPRYLRVRYPTVRSFLSVPMAINGELVGVLSCGGWETHAFGEPELKSLSLFAQQAAVALKLAQERDLQRERSEQAKEVVLQVVHDLKAPLHAINGLLDLVLRGQVGDLSEGQRDFLATARQECTRLNDTIAAVLEMGAARQQRRLAIRSVDLRVLMDEVCQRLRPVAQARQVELDSRVLDRPLLVEVDEAAVRQVLVNLVSNAIRVSPSNTVVFLTAEPDPDGVCVSIVDSGPGVPLEHREHVFDRFYQANAAARAPGEIGLGLALSRDIVERHGGRIWVEGVEDGGARVRFTLPLDRP